MNRWTQAALLLATLMLAATQGMAQPLPPDFNPGRARRDADTEQEAAKAEAAALKRRLAEEKRKQADGKPEPIVDAGGEPKTGAVSSPAYPPLTVFRDKLAKGGLGPEMVVIPAGSFEMGSNRHSAEQPIHTVKIARPFALGKTEVTQAQWRQIMGSDPSRFNGCDDCPVEMVSWHEANQFIKMLSENTGQVYRLPSEAEWEYACKAGQNSTYCGAEDIDAVAWYNLNSDKRTHRVATKTPNKWGLYDMTGNVFEWVEDSWSDNYAEAPQGGRASKENGDSLLRVVRGGSFFHNPDKSRAAFRGRNKASGLFDTFGFRLAKTIP